jgi:hypothetical protein
MSGARMIAGIVGAKPCEFVFDGRIVPGFEGEGVAAALLRAGIRGTRVTSRLHEARGYYCGMGICWECVVEIPGEGFFRGCQYPVRDGLVVLPASSRSPEDL